MSNSLTTSVFDAERGGVQVNNLPERTPGRPSRAVSEFVWATLRSMQLLANGDRVDISPAWDDDKVPDLEDIKGFCAVVNSVADYQGALEGSLSFHAYQGNLRDQDAFRVNPKWDNLENTVEVVYSSEESLLVLHFTPVSAYLEWEATNPDRLSEYMAVHMGGVMRHANSLVSGDDLE
jgi:hypothetical protein